MLSANVDLRCSDLRRTSLSVANKASPRTCLKMMPSTSKQKTHKVGKEGSRGNELLKSNLILQTTQITPIGVSTRNRILESYNSKKEHLNVSSFNNSMPRSLVRPDLKNPCLENKLLAEHELKNNTELHRGSSNLSTERSSLQSEPPKTKRINLQTNHQVKESKNGVRKPKPNVISSRKRVLTQKHTSKPLSKKQNVTKTIEAKSKQKEIVEEDLHKVLFDENVFANCMPADIVKSTQNESILTCSAVYQVDLSAKKEMNKRKLALLNMIAGSLLKQPQFNEQYDPTRILVLKAIDEVVQLDPEFILKACLYTRKELNIRTTSNFLLSVASFKKECRPFLKKYFSKCIMLPSDWIEVAEIYQTLCDVSVNFGSLPVALRKAMISKFPDFDEYQLAKYNKDKKPNASPICILRPIPDEDSDDDSVQEPVHSCVSYPTLQSNRYAKEKFDKILQSDDVTEQLIEYNAPTLKQLIRKLHISEPAAHVMGLLGKKYPASSEEFYKSRLPGAWDSTRAGKRMKLATPETWETQVSSKGNKASTWEQLLDNKKLPFMAMLRNIRNMIKAGISTKHHSLVLRKLSDERAVINSKQFPFRFFSAYAILDQLQNELTQARDEAASGAPPPPPKPRFGKFGKKKKQPNTDNSIKYDEALLEKYRKSLDTALKISTTHNVKPLPGCTYVFVDVSEHLNCPCTSARGLGKPRTVLEMGILMGLMCKYSCESCQFVLFNDEGVVRVVDSLVEGTILKNMQILLDGPVKEMTEINQTNPQPSWAWDILKNVSKIDNLMLLGTSDMEMTRICVDLLDVHKLRTGNDVLAVNIDLAGSDINPASDDKFIHIAGYSDQILRFIAERSNSGQVEHVDNIDKIYKLLTLQELGIVSKGVFQKSEADDEVQSLSNLYRYPVWRTIKIFISSTFRDMHGERDLLTRFVMPNVRKYASSMNMNVYEIDLRWGITEQEAKSERQLEICLSEVKKADIFLCMLGNRYGYIPDNYSIGNIDEFPWLTDYPPGRSITELEIYTFALHNPQEASGRAFFYFRDDAFLSTIPRQFKPDFCIESESHETKLDSLKQKIAEAGHPIVDGYPAIWGGLHDGKPIVSGLENFATSVMKNLSFGLKKLHDECPVSTDPGVLSVDHSSFAKQEAMSFVGRKSVLRNVKSFIDTKDGGVVLIAGKQGSGKTATMAQLYKALKEENSNTFCYFTSMTSDANQPITILKSLISDLANHYQLSIPIPSSYGDLASAFIKFIRLSCEETGGRKLTILIDGIDLVESLQLHWLPSPLPKGLVIVFSCTENGPAYKMLTSRYHPEVIKLGSLDVFEKAQLVRNILLMYRKRLDESPFNNQMKLILAKRDSVFPVYLKLVCDDLRIYSVFEKLSKHLRELAPTTTQFVDNLLNRLDSTYGKDLVAATLITLAVSRQGLSEDQLYEIVNCSNACSTLNHGEIDVILSWFQSGVSKIPRAPFSKLLLSANAIITRSTHSEKERINISSKEILSVILKRYSTIDKKDVTVYYHIVLAAYYLSKADCNHDGSWQGLSSEALSELPIHLIKANLTHKLEEMLCNLKFIKAKFEAGCGHHLIEDYLLLESSFSVSRKRTNQKNNTLEIFNDFVMKNSHICCKYPQLVVQQALNYSMDDSIVCQAIQLLDKQTMIIQCLPGAASSVSPIKTILFADEVTCVASNNDSCSIAVGMKSGSVKIYSTETFKEEQIFRAHTNSVTALCYLDKSRLCTCSEGGNVSVWNTKDLYRSHSIEAHRRAVTHVVATSDGRQLVTSGLDSVAKVYNSISGDDLGRFTLSRPASYVVISGDDKFAALASWDGSISIWNILENKRPGVLKGHESSVQCCCFAPNGKHIASADIKGNIFIWSYLSQIKVGSISNEGEIITRLTYFNNGKYLVGTSITGSAKVWSSSLGMLEDTIEPLSQNSESALTIAVHQNGSVAIGYHSGIVQQYNMNQSVWQIIKAHSAAVRSVCWSSKGDMIVTGSDDKLIKLFSNNKCYATFVGHTKPVKHVACSSTFVASCSDDFSVMLWKIMFLDEGAVIETPHAVLRGHDGPVSCCAFSLFGDKLLSVSYDQSLVVWDTHSSEKLVKVDRCHSDWVTACAWSDSGDFIVTGSRDFTLKLWDSKTGKERREFIGHQSAINSVSYKYGCVASACYDGSVKLWTEKGVEVASIDAHTSRANACVLGNRKIVLPPSKWSDVVETSELTRNELVRTTKPKHQNIILYTASDDGLVKKWSPFMAHLKTVLKGHSGRITDIASFGDKDNLIATVSEDKSISIWDIEKVYESNENFSASTVMCVCFNREGTLFAYCTSDGIVAVRKFSDNIKVLQAKVPFKANGICFSSCEQKILIACHDGSLLSHLVDDCLPLPSYKVIFKHNTSLLHVSCDATSAYLMSFDKTLSVQLKQSRKSQIITTSPLSDIANCVISHDNKSLIRKDVCGFMYFKLDKKEEEYKDEFMVPYGKDELIKSLHVTAVCQWRKTHVVGLSDGTVCYYDDKFLGHETIKIHDERITALDSANEFVVSASADKTVKIHNMNWKLIGIFFCESSITSLDVHKAGSFINMIIGEESGLIQRLCYKLN